MKNKTFAKIRILTGAFALAMIQATHAETAINIRGFVLDAATNAALSGATATLKANGLAATTDSKGHYSILQSSGILTAPSLESEGPIRLHGSILTYTVAEGRQQPVSISISDVMGRGVSLLTETVMGGEHRMYLAG